MKRPSRKEDEQAIDVERTLERAVPQTGRLDLRSGYAFDKIVELADNTVELHFNRAQDGSTSRTIGGHVSIHLPREILVEIVRTQARYTLPDGAAGICVHHPAQLSNKE